jgi:alkylation response protein AidB-like acyl-CoA dehydrogenase
MDGLLDQGVLRDSARKLLARVREQGNDPRGWWTTMVTHGWPGLALPEANGGMAQPFSALAVLYQELGRVLAPQTFMAASLCLGALVEMNDDDVVRDLIADALGGEAVPMAVAPRGLKSVAGRLRGTICDVLHLDEATHLLIPIEDERRIMALITLPHPGVSIQYRPTWDRTRRLFDIKFDDLELSGTFLGAADSPGSVTARMAAHHDLALACDALGGAEGIFEETLSYMQLRQQFKRPIASFQALKHRCADLSTAISASRALVTAACQAFSDRRGDFEMSAACARLHAGAVYRNVTEEAVQLHGGIGFTWEHRCHQFLKRARLNDALGGTPDQRKDALAPALFRAARIHQS